LCLAFLSLQRSYPLTSFPCHLVRSSYDNFKLAALRPRFSAASHLGPAPPRPTPCRHTFPPSRSPPSSVYFFFKSAFLHPNCYPLRSRPCSRLSSPSDSLFVGRVNSLRASNRVSLPWDNGLFNSLTPCPFRAPVTPSPKKPPSCSLLFSV